MKDNPAARRFVAFGIVAALMLCTGCFDFGTDFTYGKASGRSVNGVSVFANLLRERGHKVSRKRRLTKRFENFDTIVWAPDNPNHPPENVVAWLEDWLSQGNARTVIFIGRGYDGKLPFYQAKFENADPQQRDKWQRELAEQIVAKREFNFDWNSLVAGDSPEEFWFEADERKRIDPHKIAGPWATGIDSASVDLDCGNLLTPIHDYNAADSIPVLQTTAESDEDNDSYFYELDDWTEDFRETGLETKELLTVDGYPFAFQIQSSSDSDRKIIVISNGSFLLNFPLINPEHRKLAAKVADEVTGDVVFLESDYQWPRIGGGANDPALRWTWIGRAPMSYIVPHFLFWGVLYCFVFFPNFGRPKRVQFHPPKAFRSHVKAVASILGRSKERNWAREVVDLWLRRNNKTKN